MDIIITEWALQSYLDLRTVAFTRLDYKDTIRPDVELLNNYPDAPKFSVDRFWGPAELHGARVPDGFKMKWRNIGPGRVQLRLPVFMHEGSAFLCEAYIKNSQAREARAMAKFKVHCEFIRSGNYEFRGVL